MSLETRLANMRRYRDEAMKQPRLNKLYIEDLDLSIAMFERQLETNKPIVHNNWLDNE